MKQLINQCLQKKKAAENIIDHKPNCRQTLNRLERKLSKIQVLNDKVFSFFNVISILLSSELKKINNKSLNAQP